MTSETEKNKYRWISGYEKTWDSIKEDQSGSLVSSLDQMAREAHAHLRQKRRRLNDAGETGLIRLGMMRYLFVVLDLSPAMLEQDLKPNRLSCTLRWLSRFVEDFLCRNPTSQLGIIAMTGSKTELVTELSGSSVRHLTALEELSKRRCFGEPSIQNALTLAESRLRCMPSHYSREVVLIVGSLTSCDPGDIHQTIQSLITHHIRCNVVSLSVEVFVHRAIAEATGGSLYVVLDSKHLKATLHEFINPPPVSENAQATLIRMGFPHSSPTDFDQFSVRYCMCHLPGSENEGAASASSRPTAQYTCPRCQAAYCELPVECVVCGITLMTAPHLARAHHHLFPLAIFSEVLQPDFPTDSPLCCGGCFMPLESKPVAYRCPKCEHLFCSDCDVFLHDYIHSCPKCKT